MSKNSNDKLVYVSQGKTILVIDDDPDCCFLLEKVLSQYGYHVLVAYTGEEGIATFDKESCDGILLDVFLSDVDGMEIAQCIRNKKGSLFPIIALTTYSSENLKDQQPEAFNIFTEICEKPFDIQGLIKIIQKYL